MPRVFVTSPALCWHDTGLQQGIRGGESLDVLLTVDLLACRWLQSVRVLQSPCWTSAQPSMRFKPCCRPSEFGPNHTFPGWPYHPGRIVGTTMQTSTLRSWMGIRRLWLTKSSSSCCTRNGDRETRSTMETTSGAPYPFSPSLTLSLWCPKLTKTMTRNPQQSAISPSSIFYLDDLLLRYNIFWSEMSKVQKLGHVIKQVSSN